MKQLACVVALALVLATTPAYAHSGGTDANGCHTDSRTGTRHCHGGSGSGGGSGGGDGADAGVIAGVVLGVALLGALVAVLVVAVNSTPTRRPPAKEEEKRKPTPDNGDYDFKVDGNPDGVWLIMEGRW